MKKIAISLMVTLALVGCSSTGVGDTADNRVASVTNVETNYNVAEGGSVVIFNNDGDVTGCYDLDMNGSECTVETTFEGLYEPPIEL